MKTSMRERRDTRSRRSGSEHGADWARSTPAVATTFGRRMPLDLALYTYDNFRRSAEVIRVLPGEVDPPGATLD
jgi:hypothetical protein